MLQQSKKLKISKTAFMYIYGIREFEHVKHKLRDMVEHETELFCLIAYPVYKKFYLKSFPSSTFSSNSKLDRCPRGKGTSDHTC